MIRECGRLDIKNPYEDLTSNEGFSFTKVAVDQLVQHTTNAVANADVAMNDESNQVAASGSAAGDLAEERKGTGGAVATSTILIDTGGPSNSRSN